MKDVFEMYLLLALLLYYKHVNEIYLLTNKRFFEKRGHHHAK